MGFIWTGDLFLLPCAKLQNNIRKNTVIIIIIDVPNALIMIGTTVTFMLNNFFFNSLKWSWFFFFPSFDLLN